MGLPIRPGMELWGQRQEGSWIRLGYNEGMKRGFTLIELLVFIAIFTIVIVSLVTIFISLTNIQSNESVVSAVNEESQFLLQQIQYYISLARLIDMTQDNTGSHIFLRDQNLNLVTVGPMG